MAKKISQMTEATEIKNDDISVVVQDGETKQFPLNLLATKSQADEYKTGVETQLADYEQEITNIKNQYDKELYTPKITVTNTSIVKTGQGDTVDYSASVEDGVAKSAILKGQTLVNLIPEGRQSSFHLNNTNGGAYAFWDGSNVNMIKPSTKYLILTNVTLNTGSRIVINNNEDYISCFADGIYYEQNEVGIKKTILTSKSDLSDCTTILRSYTHTVGEVKGTIQVFEYQQGMENWNIPYFTGMLSVKMPVLTTTGKNLFSINQQFKTGNIAGAASPIEGDYISGNWQVSDFIKLNKNTDYYLSTKNFRFEKISFYDINKKIIKGTDATDVNERLISTSNNIGYIRLVIHKTDAGALSYNELVANNDIQLEQGRQATSYEPYQTNILTTPEDLELRGIGDVKDELNVATGELTQRIGEIVLDGSEEWIIHAYSNDDFLFVYTDISTKKTNNVLCDKFPKWDGTAEILKKQTQSYIWANPNKSVFVWLEKSKLSEATTQGFKDYLQSNPIILHYQLETESIKTVVLNPSGTLASETPYMWKDGSIQLSSDGLVPCLDYAVTTSRVGVIENNMNETITNEKRIHALEVILAQSTISAATDAVSLQSDLESTTMSTDGAQLETENTQDNFLYEMILLLIENNAHDESLFDKVCMFYLYGKLSDEQFTNIYNLLYPVNSEEE